MVRARYGYGSLWGGRSNLRQGVAGISVAAKAVDAYCGSKSKSNICGGSNNSLGFWVTRKSWCGSRTSSLVLPVIIVSRSEVHSRVVHV